MRVEGVKKRERERSGGQGAVNANLLSIFAKVHAVDVGDTKV